MKKIMYSQMPSKWGVLIDGGVGKNSKIIKQGGYNLRKGFT